MPLQDANPMPSFGGFGLTDAKVFVWTEVAGGSFTISTCSAGLDHCATRPVGALISASKLPSSSEKMTSTMILLPISF